MNSLFLQLNKYRNRLGKKFMNYVFRHRLGKKYWTTRVLIFIMTFLDKSQVYVNTGDVDNFDHYVPQFLLRRWKIGDTGEIFSYSKSEKTIEKKSIKEVAGAINWDITTSGGVPSDYISKKLYAEVLEQKTNYIIKYINTTPAPKLTFLEESTLAVFVGHQIARVPQFRDTLTKFFSLGYSKGLITKDDFGNKEILMDKVASNSIGITYEHLVTERPPITVSGTKQQQSLVSLVIASDMGEKIYRTRHVKFLEIPDGDDTEFVISDNPVVFLDMGRNTILDCAPWWEVGKDKFIIFMPISPKKAIVYTPVKDDEHFPTDSFIQLLTYGQYANCSEGVFSRKKEVLEKQSKYYLPQSL